MPTKQEADGSWLVALFAPVTLFSLRMTHATNKGGKTLLVPTPYSIKMALVDACFRGDQGDSEELARKVFDLVKARQIRVAPPEHCLVHNTFIKILDHDRNEAAGPYRSTIAYREFAFYKGVMSIAADASGLEAEAVSFLSSLFHRINQFGKRGSFWQCLAADTRPELPTGIFTVRRDQILPEEVPDYGATLALDDFGQSLCKAKDGFDRISTYGSGAITLDQHRILDLTAVPYSRVSASRRFSWYIRTDALKMRSPDRDR